MNRMYRKVADSEQGEYKHGSKSQIDKLEVEESMPSRFSDSRRVKDDEDYVEEPDTLIMIDGEEISYDMKCYDGYAIGKCNVVDEDIPEIIKMTYPKKSELYEDEIEEILIYRGLKGSVSPEDITYGDIMMAMGELESEYVGVSDSCKRVKDEYGSELDFAGESIKIGVDFNFDSYLFEQNYEEDFSYGEYGLDEEIDWDLVNDICADVEDELCGVIGGYFGDKHHCSYFHGGRSDDDTCYELVVEDSILIDKLTNELPVENVEDWENGVLDFYLLNNNSDLSSIWGNSVYEALEGKYSDDKTRRVLSDVIEVYLIRADILVYEPTQAIIALAEELR